MKTTKQLKCKTFFNALLYLMAIGIMQSCSLGKTEEIFVELSPNGSYKAYAESKKVFDGPDESLFIAKTENNQFRLVSDLPADIESIQKITWAPNSSKVVFATNWYLYVVDTDNFNIDIVNLNNDWWEWSADKPGTFTSTKSNITIQELKFLNDSIIQFKTDQTEELTTLPVG